MKPFLYAIRYWAPPICWMIMIFWFSSKQNVSVSDEYTLNFLVLKTIHVIIYAALYFLVFRGFHSVRDPDLTLEDKFIYAILVTLIYATLDEIHQQFVPTRTGTIRDVAIDAIGILILYKYLQSNYKNIKHFLLF